MMLFPVPTSPSSFLAGTRLLNRVHVLSWRQEMRIGDLERQLVEEWRNRGEECSCPLAALATRQPLLPATTLITLLSIENFHLSVWFTVCECPVASWNRGRVVVGDSARATHATSLQ
jgi:hypothetical protein